MEQNLHWCQLIPAPTENISDLEHIQGERENRSQTRLCAILVADRESKTKNVTKSCYQGKCHTGQKGEVVSPRLAAALRTKTLTMTYQAECCVLVLRCWCPVGVPESRCGKGVKWTRSWRRSRCPPQQPPCGIPPCPPPDGPPTASVGLGQVTQCCCQ